MRVFYKEDYADAYTTKVLQVSLLKVICVEPEFLEPPHDLAMKKQGEKFDDFTNEYVFNVYADNRGGPKEIYYHSDFLSSSYEYSDDYGHEISEDLKKVASEEKGILLQTVWDIAILGCSFDIGTTAEELANSVSWELNRGGDLLTKILLAKFSTHFFTKCAILSDVVTNHSDDESLAEFIENNDIGLPLAQRVNLAEKMSEFEEEDFDDFDYIDETWDQLCETLGIDKDGDYTSLADMRRN